LANYKLAYSSAAGAGLFAAAPGGTA